MTLSCALCCKQRFGGAKEDLHRCNEPADMAPLLTDDAISRCWRICSLQVVFIFNCVEKYQMSTCSAWSFSLSLMMALARATLFFMPPDSSPGNKGSTPDKPTAFNACATSSCRSSFQLRLHVTNTAVEYPAPECAASKTTGIIFLFASMLYECSADRMATSPARVSMK